MSKQLKFRIKELNAERERKTGQPCTYDHIQQVTGISQNSISRLATGKSKMVGIQTIERLLDFYGCEVGELMVFEE